jgi:DNA-directed RNA polymerase subunit alpha
MNLTSFENDVQPGLPPGEQEPPRVTLEEESESYVKVALEPLSPGFGITLGNSIRRVLLSSLQGAAVTSVRIEEVQHEFSTISGVKEDTMEILLNLKDLRLRALSDRPAKMYLEARGNGEVHAGEIQVAADYEIVNPDLHLATLDSDDAHLTIEFTVERGRGYLPAGESDGLPIGVIPVDAIFTPVQKVNYHVEHTRVGQITDFDKLILEVWTDGTITGVDAVSQAADNLRDELQVLAQLGKPEPPVVEHGVGRGLSLPVDKYNTPIENLSLSVRAYNCLKRSGLMTVGQVLEKSEDELLALRNFGQKSYDELKARLIELDYLDEDAEAPVSELGEEDETGDVMNPLGAALIQALKEAGEDPSELIERKEKE